MLLKFPKNFYWGTATSAYQVEGGIRNDWSAAGQKYDAGIACDHYHRYEEDFDLAKSMNNNAHRFSIEWARIEPEEGKFDQNEIEHYRKVILALRQRGLEPFVTLYHWTLPSWFVKRGGWLNRKAPEYFEQYVGFVVRNLPEVKFWIILNEPEIYSSHSYLNGAWPPCKKNIIFYLLVIKALIKGHKKAFKIIKSIQPSANIGIAKNNVYFEGWLRAVANWWWNFCFLNKIKNHQDFIGINYYFHNRIRGFKFNQNENKVISDMGWEIYPEGIYHVLKDLKRYNKPIFITENGLADADDSRREKFIVEHLKWIHKAIKEGVDMRGYIHWSLIDNFEWAWGFEPRFGLIEIDYKNNLKRTPRPSSKVYAEICKNNALNI
ncbi:MAG: glycoside hydrolase family 1 protein [Patescibacteria group bacterium]